MLRLSISRFLLSAFIFSFAMGSLSNLLAMNSEQDKLYAYHSSRQKRPSTEDVPTRPAYGGIVYRIPCLPGRFIFGDVVLTNNQPLIPAPETPNQNTDPQ